VATGTAYTVQDFLRFSFNHVGLDWRQHVRIDQRYVRPAEVDALIGDASRARNLLHWEPQVLTPELARIMVDADLQVDHSPVRVVVAIPENTRIG